MSGKILMLSVTFIIVCCSFDGGKVKDYNDFLDEKKRIINLKILQCGLTNESNDGRRDLSSSLLLLLALPESSLTELGFIKSHVTDKDAQFCYDSLLSVQCGRNTYDSAQNIIITNLLYCNPKPACMGDKQNLGQGAICISGE